jgi:hypothetical protein
MQPNVCTVQKLKEDMTGREGERERENQPRRHQNELPPEIFDIIVPALKVGGIAGKSCLFNWTPFHKILLQFQDIPSRD